MDYGLVFGLVCFCALRGCLVIIFLLHGLGRRRGRMIGICALRDAESIRLVGSFLCCDVPCSASVLKLCRLVKLIAGRFCPLVQASFL